MTPSPPLTSGSGSGSRVASAGELAALVPYLLGFQPQDSLVLIALDHEGRLGCTARLDLPAPGEVEARGARASVEHVVRTVDGPVWAPLVWTDDPRLHVAATALVERVRELVGEGSVWAPVLVSGGEWGHLACGVQGCDQGGRLPAPEEVAAVTEHVVRGVAPSSSRGQVADDWRPGSAGPRVHEVWGKVLGLEERLDPHGLCSEVVDGLPRVLPRLSEGHRRRGLLAWRGLVLGSVPPHAGPPDPLEVAWAAVTLADTDLRDAIAVHLTPGTLEPGRWPGAAGRVGEILGPPVLPSEEPEECAKRLERLRQVVRHTPPEVATPLLTVVAAYAWWLGDGAVASICVGAALEATPSYRLAVLVDASIRSGVRWPTADGPNVGAKVS